MNNFTQEQSAARQRTLLIALLLSMWAPLVTGIAVVMSTSTTQLADFVRRTVEPGGNVYPGLIIASLGVIVNSWFWRRYARLNREQYNSIINAQRQLYQAKALVDLLVIGALGAVAVAPDHYLTYYIDYLGSFALVGYLFWNALRTAAQTIKRPSENFSVD